MPKKKLLIISFSAGSGHVRAAEAIRKTAEIHFPGVTTVHIDLADYLPTTTKAIILKSYLFAASKIPSLWRFLYEHTNDDAGQELLEMVTQLGANINAGKLYRFIDELQPDYIINTHFLSTKLLFARKTPPTAPVSTVVTDYDVHEYWITEGTHTYFVASEKIVWKLKKKGIPYRNIVKSGIPIDPVFFTKNNVSALKKQQNIPQSKPLVLVLSGGQGIGRTIDIVTILRDLETPCQIIAIAGNNFELQTKLATIPMPEHISLTALGWTDQMDQYMRMADVIVSKPGGLTTTECMTLKKWLIAAMPIPGQEEVNATFLLDHQAGSVATTYEDLLFYTEEQLKHPRTVQYRPKPAAETILKHVEKELKKTP